MSREKATQAPRCGRSCRSWASDVTPAVHCRTVARIAKRDTLVFVPAWNEEQGLPTVLEELRAELPGADVLVVDDGSTDRTAEVAGDLGAEVLSFGEHRGLRAAIAAGYEPTPARRLGTGLLRGSMSVVLGCPFHDATSGMLAANARATAVLARPYTSGAPEVEAVLRLHEEGLRVQELPVHMRSDRAGSRSSRARRRSSSS